MSTSSARAGAKAISALIAAWNSSVIGAEAGNTASLAPLISIERPERCLFASGKTGVLALVVGAFSAGADGGGGGALGGPAGGEGAVLNSWRGTSSKSAVPNSS